VKDGEKGANRGLGSEMYVDIVAMIDVFLQGVIFKRKIKQKEEDQGAVLDCFKGVRSENSGTD